MQNENLDILKVVSSHVLAGVITLADKYDWIKIMAENIQTALSISSIILAICYTAWKWKNDIRKKKSNIKKHNNEKNAN